MEINDKQLSQALKFYGWVFIFFGLNINHYLKPLMSSKYLLENVEKMNMANINHTVFSYKFMCIWGVVGSILLFITGILLLNLKEMGRKIAIFYSAGMALVCLSLTVFHLIRNSNTPSIILPFVSLILPAGLLWYFTNSKVKQLFKQGQSKP